MPYLMINDLASIAPEVVNRHIRRPELGPATFPYGQVTLIGEANEP